MKPEPRNPAASRFLLPLLALAAACALPLPALAAGVELATVPMATSTTTTVKPNLMFVLDDSGSMDWDYLPSEAKNFANKYGYNSPQCNGNYYNPSVTYTPPVTYTGQLLNAVVPGATPEVEATTFAAAYKDGYATSAGTTNLSTGFTGGSGSGASGISLTPGPAFYYAYSGSQTTNALKKYTDTSSIFYQECDSAIGSTAVIGGAAVNTRFTLVRLAAVPTTTITVSGAGGGANATITISTGGSKSKFSSVKVNGVEILPATTSSSSKSSSNATNIKNGINLCTSAATGNCVTVGGTGFSATSAGGVVTVIGPASAAGFPSVLTIAGGTPTWSSTNFPAAPTATTLSSITVAGVDLLQGAGATGTTINLLATDVASKINASTGTTGFSATVAGNIVTVTAPTSASTLTPVITVSAGDMALTTLAFPESTPTKLQNFANWYSYYSNRMLMMKTGAGLAFQNVTDKYRVGFLTMNNNVSPGIVEVGTFTGTQKSNWYSKLYGANPGGMTPLREALSKVGQYYAHRFGSITTYKATITVGGSGDTAADSITVGGTEIMEDQSVSDASTGQVAKNVAAQINSLEITDYGATVSGNVITITGPASADGTTPVVTQTGSMTFSATAFTGTTTTALLNGISPADPMQYSCQQNFTILSTDGYWNGATTYNLSGSPVGQVDGSQPRPYSDGAQTGDTVTTTYTRNNYNETGTALSGGTNCVFNYRRITITPQTRSCTVTGGGSPVCTTEVNGTAYYDTPYTGLSSSCLHKDTISVPALNPTNWVVQAAPPANPVTVTGVIGGVSNTLADVAMYYYQTDLRTALLGNCDGAPVGGVTNSVCENNVFISGNDNNLQQHMTTFTLGLGVRGQMVYSPSYLTDTTGDFAAVKLGSTATATVCTWQGNNGLPCNWPTPVSGQATTVDDLWHAAVNGRGAYFSATDPESLALGLANALTSISSKVGAAAAAATSTLNPVAGNNFAYVASYTTLSWTGNLESRGINTETGVVSENATWCLENVSASACAAPASIVADASGDVTAYFCVTPSVVVCVGGELVGTDCRVPVATSCTGSMNSRVDMSSDTRLVKTANSTGTALIEFDAAYRLANPTHFDAAKLAGLSQWPPATNVSTEAVALRANAPGDNLLNYLRGQRGHEIGRSGGDGTVEFYRMRDRVIGDALESQPAFIGPPIFSYPYPGYAEFRLPYDVSTNPTGQGSRAGTVYMGTNDGFMHAFNADTGAERWVYLPSMVIPNLWKLADSQYADRHTNYVNGSPITTDICTANCANAYNASTPGTNPVWKTILVAGLNGGGRGYFALDITSPDAPALLWEFKPTATTGRPQDPDLGYTFGQPVVTRKADGTWVVLVTSGYDNGTDSATKVSSSFVANSPAGDGKGYLYVLDAATGAIISKISTGVGTAASPSGLAKIAGYNAESGGNKVSYVYGGDLIGNIWRFDINAATAAAIGTGSAFNLATLYSETAATNPQPIMTTPILGTILGKRIVFIGTGKYLEIADLSTTQVQTQYAIKDDDATTTLVNPRTTLVQQFMIPNPDGTATRLGTDSASATTPGANDVDFGIGRGWLVDLPDGSGRERVNIDAKLVLGTLIVPTIVPSSTACSPGGSGWLNFFNYKTGGPVNTTTGVTSAKYDSTIVGVNVLFIGGEPIVEVVTSTDPTPKKDDTGEFAKGSAGFAGKRVMWRELIPQD